MWNGGVVPKKEVTKKGALKYLNQLEQQQVKLGFTRACRSIEKLGKKWLKTW